MFPSGNESPISYVKFVYTLYIYAIFFHRFHQVDSDCLTIAVNFWWQSEVMLGMSEHMDAYYMRRIVKRLTDKEMNRTKCFIKNQTLWVKQ